MYIIVICLLPFFFLRLFTGHFQLVNSLIALYSNDVYIHCAYIYYNIQREFLFNKPRSARGRKTLYSGFFGGNIKRGGRIA